MVNSFKPDHVLYFFYSNTFQIPLLTYGGVLFDLLIPFAFWYKPNRKWALIPAFFFHISNSLVFDDIGIFPFIMIFPTAIFFPIDEIPILRNFKALPVKKTHPVSVTSSEKKNVLLGIITFQLLFPFRGFLLPANMDWTSVGNSFSWRMKIQTSKIEKFAFTIQDGLEGQALNVQMNTFINPMQALIVVKDARAVLACTNAIAREGRKKGMKNPIVKAQILISWNGRKPVYFVNPDVDLTKQHFELLGDNSWLTPKPD